MKCRIISVLFLFLLLPWNAYSIGNIPFTSEVTLIFPVKNEVINTLTPTFKWVTHKRALFLEFKLFEKRKTRWINIYTARPWKQFLTLKGGILKPGSNYKWTVRLPFSNRFTFETFTTYSTSPIISSNPNIKFAKTVFIPVEFKNHKHQKDYRKKVEELINYAQLYVKSMSLNRDKKLIERFENVIIAPLVSLPNDYEYYGKDIVVGGQTIKDAGKFKVPYGGMMELEREVLEALIEHPANPIDVLKCEDFVFLFPEPVKGDYLGGYCAGSKLPKDIYKYDSNKDKSAPDNLKFKTFPSWRGVFMELVGPNPLGCRTHELMHLLCYLPDTYPYNNIPDRDLKWACLMAVGSYYNVSLSALLRDTFEQRSNYKEFVKEKWLNEKIYNVKKGEEAEVQISPRDSKMGKYLAIKIETTYNNKEGFAFVEAFTTLNQDKFIINGRPQENRPCKPYKYGVIIYFSDSDRSRKARLVKLLCPDNKPFLKGGEVKFPDGTKIEVLDVNYQGAKIKISRGNGNSSTTPPPQPKKSWWQIIVDIFNNLFKKLFG